MAPHGTPDAHIVIYRGDCAEDCSGCVAVVADGQTYSSGTVVFSAGPNITISTVGQTIFIEGAAAGTGAGISAIVGSNATYSTGTVIFTGAGDITVASTTGQKFIISGSQSAYVFSDSNDFTFGTNGSTVTASFSQSTHSHGSNGPTAIVGSDATYSTGTVVFTGSGAATVKSAPGQQVVIDVSESTHAHSSVVFSDSNNVTFGLNAGTLTASASFPPDQFLVVSASDSVFTSGTVAFTGAGIVTVATDGTGTQQTVIISATESTHAHSEYIFSDSNNVTFGTAGSTVTASASFAAGNAIGAIQASDATYSSGTVVFTGSNAITVRSTTGQQVVIDMIESTHSHQTVPTALIGSDATYTSGSVVFSGSGALTVKSAAGQKLIFDVTESTHSHSTSPSAIVASDATYTSGSVVFSGSNAAVVKSAPGQKVIIDVPTQTQFVLSNSNAFTFGTNASTVTASFSQSTHVHSAFVISDSNGLVWGTNGSTVTGSYTQLAIQGIFAPNTDGSIFHSGTVYFTGTNGVDVNASYNGIGGQTVFIGGSTHSHSTSPSAIVVSNTTYTSGSVVFTGAGVATVASTTGQKVIISVTESTHSHSTSPSAIVASNMTATSGSVIFTGTGGWITVNTSAGQTVGISVSTHSHSTVPSAIVASDATFTSGTVIFTGSNAITVRSTTGQKVVIDMTESTHAHTAYVFSNSNNFTFGTNASTVTASFSESTHSHAAGGGVAIAGSNTTFTSGTVVFTGSNITVSTAGAGANQTIGISGPPSAAAGGISQMMASPSPAGHWAEAATADSSGVTTFQQQAIWPVYFPGPMTIGAVGFQFNLGAGALSNTTGTATVSCQVALYTQPNSTVVSSLSSSAVTFTLASSQSALHEGPRRWTASLGPWSLTQGQYYVAFKQTNSRGPSAFSIQAWSATEAGVQSGVFGINTSVTSVSRLSRFMINFAGNFGDGFSPAFPPAAIGLTDITNNSAAANGTFYVPRIVFWQT